MALLLAGLIGGCEALSPPQAPSPPPAAHAETPAWGWQTLAFYAARDVVTIDAGARRWVAITADTDTAWSLFEDDGHGGLRQLRAAAHHRYDRTICGMAAGELDGDPDQELAVLRCSARLVEIWDVVRFEIVRTLRLQREFGRGISLRDLDGDGIDELILGNDDQDGSVADLAVYDRAGRVWLTRRDAATRDLRVAQMDADPAWEAVSRQGVVVDLTTGQPELTLPVASGGVALADLDGDGDLDPISNDRAGSIVGYDVETGGQIMSFRSEATEFLRTADVDGDGLPELIGATLAPAPSTVVVHALPSGALMQRVPIAGAVTALAVVDADGDGIAEIYADSGGLSGQTVTLRRIDGASGTVTWSDEDLGSPWRGPALGDFDGDGVTEAVAATQGTMYGGGTRLLAFDTAAHTLEAMSEPFQDEASFAGTQDLEVTDADGDGVDELLLTRWDGASAIWQRFGLTRIGEFIELSAGAVAAPELSPQAVAAVDLGLDGTPEILMGVSVLPPGRHGLAAFDLHGRLTGARTLGDDPVIELRQADLDHDGDPELVTLTSRALTAFDLRTMTPIASLTGQLPGHFIAMDVTPDGRVLTAEGLQEVGVYELGRRGLRSVARWHIRDELRSVRAAGADRVLLIGRWVGPFSRGSLSVHETLSGRSLWETSHDHDANDGQWLAVEPSTGELWSAGASSVYAWALP